MVVNSIFLELFLSVLPVAILPVGSDGIAGPVEPDVLSVSLDGPVRGTHPGDVRLFGRVEGTAPFELKVNGIDVHVSAGKRWEIVTPLEVGNSPITMVVTDATSESIEVVVELLILPDFKVKDTRPIIYVESADELVENLGNQRLIVLRSGDYVLNRVDKSLVPEGCEKVGGTGNIILRDLRHMDLVGTSGQTSRIINDSRAGTALTLRDCREVNLYGLKIAHEPRGQDGESLALPMESRGGAVSLGATYIVRLRNCELSGEGVGIAMRHINAFALVDSVVRDCTGGAVLSRNSKHMTFSDTEFLRNGRGRPGDIGVSLLGDRIDIEFVGCTLRENKPAPRTGLFEIDRQGIFSYFRDGVIEGNHARSLTSGRAKDHLKVIESKVQRF